MACIFYNKLIIEPEEHGVLLTECVLNSEANKKSYTNNV